MLPIMPLSNDQWQAFVTWVRQCAYKILQSVSYVLKSHFTNVHNVYASKAFVYTTNLQAYIVSSNYLVACAGTYKLCVQAYKPTFILLCSFSLNESSDSVLSVLLSRKPLPCANVPRLLPRSSRFLSEFLAVSYTEAAFKFMIVQKHGLHSDYFYTRYPILA